MSVFQLNKGGAAKAVIFGVLISLAVIIVITCLISAALLFAPSVPYSALPYIALAADAAGAFTGAYFAASKAKSKGLVTGLLCSGFVFLILLIAGFAAGSGTLTAVTALKLVVLLVFGALGGIKGVNKKDRIRIK